MRMISILIGCVLGAASALSTAAPADDWKPTAAPLSTEWGRQVTPDNAWREYPRPHLVRRDWLCLNGLWDCAVVDRPAGETGVPTADSAALRWDDVVEATRRILVPFCVESSLSGVGRGVTASQEIWYRRRVQVPEAWHGRRVMLRFEAVDWHATVWVNGTQLGAHAGGFDPFAFDITPHLRAGDNEIVLRAWDPTDQGPQPRGKQVLKPGGIWYTPVSGIWQSVWLEPVPERHVTGLLPVADVARGEVEITVEVAAATADGPPPRVRILAGPGGGVMGEGDAGRPIRCPVEEPRPWTPDDPHLHPIVVELVAADGAVVDRVDSYVALRSIAIGKDERGIQRLLLNGKPLFQIGPLDQGWWPDGLLTPPSDAAMRYDLEVIKRLGMNMLRKHVKVEPARYYHHCDRLGLLVWQDQPNGGELSRNHHIAAATPDAAFTPEEKAQFRLELGRMIERLRFFPSIVVWVPFNEGWGQHDTNEILAWVKQRDPTRIVDGPSGWVDRGFGDMRDRHDYPGPTMFPVMLDRASVLGEFGGLGLPVPGHLWKETDTWGYRTFPSEAELRAAYGGLIERLHDLIGRGLAAAVYTQTTDVEVEVNGLLTYDRAVLKVDPEETAARHRSLFPPPP
ncbi:MAG: glycoside hydrolase family 2 protein [Planctomycetaceae bacterium]